MRKITVRRYLTQAQRGTREGLNVRGVSRRSVRLVLAALALALLMGPAALPAAALQGETNGGGDTADLLTPDSGAYFGSILDWSADSVKDQADRLGSPSPVYEHAAGVPLPESSKLYLDQFLDQVQTQGALSVITLTPTVELSEVDAGVAGALVDNLVDVLRGRHLPAYLRFAPDMNST